jgi:hypothetical protein
MHTTIAMTAAELDICQFFSCRKNEDGPQEQNQ